MAELEVTWINGVRRLRPTSMEKCYQGLAHAFRELAPEDIRISVDEIEGTPLPAFRGLINRYIIYGFMHLHSRTGIYHVLDHANAHVVRLLPKSSIKILTVNDIEQLTSPWYRINDLLFKTCGLPGIRAADRVVAISEATRDEVLERTGYPPERIQVINVGIDHDIYYPATDAFPSEPPYILYVGSEHPRKNMPVLLRTLKELRPEGIRLKKAGLPGGTENRRATQEEAVGLGIDDLIDYLGFVSEKELASLYRGALALVMPSLYEGFGMPLIEAMACGCPVVCSDIPVFREVTGEAALLLPPEDGMGMAGAVLKLAGDAGFRAHQVDEGLRRAAGFSWERCAAEHVRLYRELA